MGNVLTVLVAVTAGVAAAVTTADAAMEVSSSNWLRPVAWVGSSGQVSSGPRYGDLHWVVQVQLLYTTCSMQSWGLRGKGAAGCGGSVIVVPDGGRSNSRIVPWLGFTVRIGDAVRNICIEYWAACKCANELQAFGRVRCAFLQSRCLQRWTKAS